jgi:small subunit ribosomal protein S20
MAEAAPKKEVKTKRPSALKRDLQNEKRRVSNKSHRAQVLTSIRALSASVSSKDPADVAQKKLNLIYSLMDKGVKRGVFKANKAARTKSRLTARLNKA